MKWRNCIAIAAAAMAAAATLCSAAEAQTRPPANWQGLIDQYLEANLKDPYSAVKKVTRGPRYGSFKLGFFRQPAGWIVCYSINAKNGFGAYGGVSPYLFRLDETGVKQEIHGADLALTISEECALSADPAPGERPSGNPEIPL